MAIGHHVIHTHSATKAMKCQIIFRETRRMGILYTCTLHPQFHNFKPARINDSHPIGNFESTAKRGQSKVREGRRAAGGGRLEAPMGMLLLNFAPGTPNHLSCAG